jgi:hypothetical protein
MATEVIHFNQVTIADILRALVSRRSQVDEGEFSEVDRSLSSARNWSKLSGIAAILTHIASIAIAEGDYENAQGAIARLTHIAANDELSNVVVKQNMLGQELPERTTAARLVASEVLIQQVNMLKALVVGKDQLSHKDRLGAILDCIGFPRVNIELLKATVGVKVLEALVGLKTVDDLGTVITGRQRPVLAEQVEKTLFLTIQNECGRLTLEDLQDTVTLKSLVGIYKRKTEDTSTNLAQITDLDEEEIDRLCLDAEVLDEPRAYEAMAILEYWLKIGKLRHAPLQIRHGAPRIKNTAEYVWSSLVRAKLNKIKQLLGVKTTEVKSFEGPVVTHEIRSVPTVSLLEAVEKVIGDVMFLEDCEIRDLYFRAVWQMHEKLFDRETNLRPADQRLEAIALFNIVREK